MKVLGEFKDGDIVKLDDEDLEQLDGAGECRITVFVELRRGDIHCNRYITLFAKSYLITFEKLVAEGSFAIPRFVHRA